MRICLIELRPTNFPTSLFSDSDSTGDTFVLMFMDIEGNGKFPELYLTTSSEDTVSVTVSTAVDNYERDLGVSSSQPGFDSLSGDTRLRGSTLENKGILVTAAEDISLFGVNKEAFSVDGFLVLPIEALGVEYYAVAYYPEDYSTQLGVVAVEDNTDVSVALPREREVTVDFDGQQYGSGDVITVRMNRLDALQVQSDDDLTGAHIYSDKPVAAFSGNKRVEIDGEPQTADHVVSQLIPVRSWGQTFVIIPFLDRSTNDRIRILASEPDTRVTIYNQTTDTGLVITEAGDFIERLLASDTIHFIQANKAIQVVQFGKSYFADDQVGDTTMLIIPSVDQYSSEYRFSTPDASDAAFSNNFAMVVLEEADLNDLFLDGDGVSDLEEVEWTDVPGSDPLLVATTISVDKGTHYITHDDPEVTFGVTLFGYTDDESYSMPAGMNVFEISLKVCEH